MKKNIVKALGILALCISISSCAMHHRGGHGGGHDQRPSHGDHRP